ncbi:MAG: hypothetical protein ACKVP7_19560 [Hyphomicrobiaceae bacterium]
MSVQRFGGLSTRGRIIWLVMDVVIGFIVFWPILLGPFIADMSWGWGAFWLLCLSLAGYLYGIQDIGVLTVLDEDRREVRILTYKTFLRWRDRRVAFDQIDRLAWTSPPAVQSDEGFVALPVPFLHLKSGDTCELTPQVYTSISADLDATRRLEAQVVFDAVAAALDRHWTSGETQSLKHMQGLGHA